MEEADARIVPHVVHAVTHRISRIIVLSSDTDVFVLMVFHWNVLHSHGLNELWVKAEVVDSTRVIPIHVLTAQIGDKFCQVLPAWIQHSMGLRRLTTSVHQRWTPAQYQKSLLSAATV